MLIGRFFLIIPALAIGDRWRESRLRVHMGHIRRKLEADGARPKHFITDLGLGYRFEHDV